MYKGALLSVNGRQCVSDYLKQTMFNRTPRLVSIGKAACSMTLGAIDVIGAEVAGLVITKNSTRDPAYDELLNYNSINVITASHPVPDSTSIDAGNELLRFIAASPDDSEMLFLISGGASSLVEVLPEGVSLADLKNVNQWLLASGLAIDEINTVRKSISCIKGGRLVHYLGKRKALCLLISDVPEDRLPMIGSGLLVADKEHNQKLLSMKLPGWLKDLTSFSPGVPDDGEIFRHVELKILARNLDAQQSVASQARSMGYNILRSHGQLTGDALYAVQGITDELINGQCGIYIWGGETTLELPERVGSGGRCQHMALEAARLLDGIQNVLLLVASTDGSDGPTENSGALIDGNLITSGTKLNMLAQDHLRRYDSAAYLNATNALVVTGQTGTNVMDLIIGLKFEL